MTDTDDALVAMIVRDGSETAFRELFRRHTPRLLQFVMRVLGSAAAEAEDVVQDTWLRAAGALGNFRGDSSFGTWLCGIGLDASLEDLDWAIARLPDGCRTVLVLHDVEGFTHDEIASRLGIAEGTSKAQLFKARRAMRALLTRQEISENVQ